MSKLLEVARTYIGQEEVPPNLEFIDKDFERRIRGVGWRPKYAWCCSAMKLCALEALPEWYAEHGHIIKHGVLRTYRGFKKYGYTVNKSPRPGDFAIFQRFKNGEPTTQGHIGLVAEAHDNHMILLEGNTNKAGSREGKYFMEKERGYPWWEKNGLRLIGFARIE